MKPTIEYHRYNLLCKIRQLPYKLSGHMRNYREPADRVPRLHISDGNMKLGDIPNFSLTPGVSCSKCAQRTCLQDGCYALGSYWYPSVKKAWDDNTFLVITDLPRVERGLNQYFDSMAAPRFFRVHVGGDFINRKYAEMWSRVAKTHPHTMFLAFTKQWNKIRDVDFPANFTLILSDWVGTEIPTDLREKYHVAWCNDGSRPDNTFPADCLECPGNCDHCGACWNVQRDTMFHKH